MSIFNANDLAMIPQTEIEKFMLIFLWQAEEISEGRAAEDLGLDRLEARALRDKFINQALAKFGEMHPRKPEPSENFDGTTIPLSEWIRRELAIQEKFGEMMDGNSESIPSEKIKAEFLARFSDKHGIQIPEQCLSVEFKSRDFSEFRHNPIAIISISYQSEKGKATITFNAKLDWFIEDNWPMWNLSADALSEPSEVYIYLEGKMLYQRLLPVFVALEEAVHRFGPMVGEL